MIKINEIFYSIQGESSLVGLPTVFVRTSGCHLRCTYCDTTYAYNSGTKMSIEQIIEEVSRHSTPFVCVTGGEPLLQNSTFELLNKLCDLDYRVSLETSGDISCDQVDARVKKIIDVKTPDSGEPKAFCMENLKFSDVNTEFKFVICSERDFLWSHQFATEHSLYKKSNVLFSPSFGKIEERWLAEKILKEKIPARLQLQMHKYIWSPQARGV